MPNVTKPNVTRLEILKNRTFRGFGILFCFIQFFRFGFLLFGFWSDLPGLGPGDGERNSPTGCMGHP